MRFLVVDDDAVDRKTVTRALAKAYPRAEVVEAPAGGDALERAGEGGFDCIVLDYRLPDLDGLDLLEQLSAGNGGSPPMVMLTGAGDERIAVDAMKRGAADYLPKDGMTAESLAHTVANAMEKAELRRELDAANRQLARMALYDQLTGLGNRNLFTTTLTRLLATARRNATPVALMIMDLNKFKQINDTDGHEAGDYVLAEIGRRLRDLTRDADIVFRLGGDEFAALLETGVSTEGAATMAHRINTAIAEPIARGDRHYDLGVSIGIAFYPGDAETADDLVRQADAAMYTAKRGGLVYATVKPPDAS